MFKVLVAEDEPKSRGALISRLRGILGDAALIEAASDGNDAVDKALRVQPDVIFMDIEMPGKNGLEAAAVIKKQIQTVHIIFLTASRCEVNLATISFMKDAANSVILRLGEARKLRL